MNAQNHISDADLRLVLVQQETAEPHDTIEDHVATCQHCQQRLLNLAADETWRDDFSSSVAALSSQSAFDETNTRCIDSAAASLTTDAFDRQSIDAMLEKILQSPTHPEMLGRLGRYEIEELIGCGGMGVVLRAFDRELHRPVAIKIIRPRLAHNGTAKQRFLREAKAAAAVLHPNVIAIHDISESEGVPWFVMPLVVGPSLKEVVEQNGPLPAKEVVRIGMQIAAGLAAAHSQGLVHRDIKPANILVDNQVNRIVITDFGLARREAEESMTQTGMVAGTLNYMSPEQSRGEDVDARSDLFSLGSLLYFLAAGVMPFRSSAPMGVVHKIGNVAHPNPQSINPDVPDGLAVAIDRLLEKSAEDRFQSASKVEVWLHEYLAHLNQPVTSLMPQIPVKPKPKVNQPRRWTNSLAVAAVSIAALAAGVSLIPSGWYSASAEKPLTVEPAPSPSPNPNPNSNPNSNPNPELLWGSIQAKYQIDSADKFEADFESLSNSMRQLSNLGSNSEPTGDASSTWNTFESDTMQLQQQIKEFSSFLNSMDSGAQ